jgi:hypothetical protein
MDETHPEVIRNRLVAIKILGDASNPFDLWTKVVQSTHLLTGGLLATARPVEGGHRQSSPADASGPHT